MAGKETQLSTYCQLTAVAVLLILQTAVISGAPLLERNARQSATNDTNIELLQFGFQIISDALTYTPTLPEQHQPEDEHMVRILIYKQES